MVSSTQFCRGKSDNTRKEAIASSAMVEVGPIFPMRYIPTYVHEVDGFVWYAVEKATLALCYQVTVQARAETKSISVVCNNVCASL